MSSRLNKSEIFCLTAFNNIVTFCDDVAFFEVIKPNFSCENIIRNNAYAIFWRNNRIQ